MHETLQEYADSRATRLSVDRQQSVIRGVKILGLRSRNGRVYLPAALAGAVALYEGAKVNINHPKGHPHSPRDYQDRIGTLRNVCVRGGDGLFGDLHLNPAHALAEQLLWDAEHAPDNVGLSHNVQAQTARRGDEIVVEAILKVQGVDLVADPATTRGLFESATAAAAVNSAEQHTPRSEAASHPTADAIMSGSAEPASAVLLSTLEGADSVVGQLRAERDALAAEVERLRAQLARHERHELVRRLLAEQGLPDIDSRDAKDRSLVGQAFLESLLRADSESTVRELIVERANLIAAARERSTKAIGTKGERPRSREQQPISPTATVKDVHEFVRAIT